MPITLLVLFALPVPHKLCAKLELQGERLQVEAWFDNDTPADGAKVKLLAGARLLHEAVTNERGLCTVPTPAAGQYSIEVNAGGGHRTEIVFTLGTEAAEQVAGENQQSVQLQRWWGAVAGLFVILMLTLLGRFLTRKHE